MDRYIDEIEGIILFSSVVRGEGKEDSNVDIFAIRNGDKLEWWDALKRLAEREKIVCKFFGGTA